MAYAVEVKKLGLKFKERVILNDVNIQLEKGSITGIVGLSGAGKTSLLRIVNGDIENDSYVALHGEVLLFGDSAKEAKSRTIATVYQDPDSQIIFPNVLDEITFGMENYCFSYDMMDGNIKRFAKALGIEHLLERNPNNLSGGEKQLVILCAILCIQPKILLLDECISQVDEVGKERAKKLFRELAKEGVTIVMVEHDFANLAIAHKIYELKNTDLKIVRKEDSL